MQHPLIVAGTDIRQDEHGRYCLNDLHRAAGGESRHQPSNWLRMQQTLDLVTELDKTGIPQIRGIESKQGLGTFVCKELVYAYAMWISASFNLKVIRAYDAMVTNQPTAPAFNIPQTLPEALRLAADEHEGRMKALALVAEKEQQIVEMLPAQRYYDDAVDTSGLMTMEHVAKSFGIGRNRLFELLRQLKYIPQKNVLPYQRFIDDGMFRVKETRYEAGAKASRPS